jgi:hypothetical protein
VHPRTREPEGARALALAAVRLGLLLAVPLLPYGWLRDGTAGLLTVAAVLLFVAGSLAATAALMGRAARSGPAPVVGVLLGAFLAKIAVLGVALVTLRPLGVVDGEVLAVTVVVGLIALLGYQVYVAFRHEELWWVDDRREQRG